MTCLIHVPLLIESLLSEIALILNMLRPPKCEGRPVTATVQGLVQKWLIFLGLVQGLCLGAAQGNMVPAHRRGEGPPMTGAWAVGRSRRVNVRQHGTKSMSEKKHYVKCNWGLSVAWPLPSVGNGNGPRYRAWAWAGA